MKTRCFDHIDLRVKDIAAAGKFYAKFLPQLGFAKEKPGKKFHIFYSAGGDKPSEFFGLVQDKRHKPMARESHSGRIHAEKWIASRSWCGRLAAKRWKVPKSARITAPAITRVSSRIRTVTDWKFAVGKDRSMQNEGVSTDENAEQLADERNF